MLRGGGGGRATLGPRCFGACSACFTFNTAAWAASLDDGSVALSSSSDAGPTLRCRVLSRLVAFDVGEVDSDDDERVGGGGGGMAAVSESVSTTAAGFFLKTLRPGLMSASSANESTTTVLAELTGSAEPVLVLAAGTGNGVPDSAAFFATIAASLADTGGLTAVGDDGDGVAAAFVVVAVVVVVGVSN